MEAISTEQSGASLTETREGSFLASGPRTLIEALDSAPGDRPFVTAWIDEDERQSVTFAEFRCRSRVQAALLHNNQVAPGGATVCSRATTTAPTSLRRRSSMAGTTPVISVPI